MMARLLWRDRRVETPMFTYLDEASACSTVDTHRRAVDEFMPVVKRMSALTATSKSFRARLELRDHEVPILQSWASRKCALHTCFRSGRGTTVLVALRAVPQSSSSFARTIRSALRSTGVSTAGIRGHWLFLITPNEAISVCVGNAELPPELPRSVEKRCISECHPPMASATVDDHDRDAKIVEIIR